MNKKDLTQMRDSIEIDRNKAFETLQQFSEIVVTQQQPVRFIDKLILFYSNSPMKILAAVLAIFLVIIVASQGFQKKSDVIEQPTVALQQTVTSSVTPIATTVDISTDANLTQFANEIEASLKDIDTMQAELAEIEKSLSTADIDTLSNQLNSIN